MYRIYWDDTEETVSSTTEVDRTLDRLEHTFQTAQPQLVTVERTDTGDSLSVGLGLDVSVLNFVKGDKNPPYFTSAGGSADGDESVSFLFGGEWSEYPRRNAVVRQTARAAMRHFCETGQLPKSMSWEEV